MTSGTPHKKNVSQVSERDRWINWRRVHHIKNQILDGNITTTGQIYRLKGIISFLSYEKKQVLWVACKTAGYPQLQLSFLFEGWAPDGVTA